LFVGTARENEMSLSHSLWELRIRQEIKVAKKDRMW
jgi:hypothetical protein